MKCSTHAAMPWYAAVFQQEAFCTAIKRYFVWIPESMRYLLRLAKINHREENDFTLIRSCQAMPLYARVSICITSKLSALPIFILFCDYRNKERCQNCMANIIPYQAKSKLPAEALQQNSWANPGKQLSIHVIIDMLSVAKPKFEGAVRLLLHYTCPF